MPVIDPRLASRAHGMQSNAIREILKVVSRPGMVSLAGGIPAAESFPIDKLGHIFETVMEKYGAKALQYDATEGFMPLRDAVAQGVKPRGINVNADDVLIYSGSQSAIDICGKMLISPEDFVACEEPTYLGALSAFAPYEPQYVRLESDHQGLIPESLDAVLSQYDIKLVYLTPTFQNPTGRTLGLERRQQIGEILKRHDALLYEDDPYSLLRYRGEALPTIWSFAPENVIYASTFSKVFAPGLRTGYAIVPQWLRPWLVVAKQGADLHTSTLNQALAAEYLSGGYLDVQLEKIIDLYKPRQEAMLMAMKTFFPPEFTWIKPDGGMFIWAEGPDGFDAEKAYWDAIEHKVAFVPGAYFFAQAGAGLSTMRLNFTTQDDVAIQKAVEVLASCIKRAL